MTRKEQIYKAACDAKGIRVKDFTIGAEWADQNPCTHDFEPDTSLTIMRCDWCGIEADRLSENKKLSVKLKIAIEALEKIADPRKRDHKEPDKYTEVGCMIHIAEQALEEIS